MLRLEAKEPRGSRPKTIGNAERKRTCTNNAIIGCPSTRGAGNHLKRKTQEEIENPRSLFSRGTFRGVHPQRGKDNCIQLLKLEERGKDRV